MPGNTDQDPTNWGLARLFSVEMMGSLLVTAFLVGGTYTALAENDKKQDDKIVSIQTEQEQVKKTVNDIKVDVAVIKANQGHTRDELRSLKATNQRILDILERR
jgi:Tfp pilus assembly protein PilO